MRTKSISEYSHNSLEEYTGLQQKFLDAKVISELKGVIPTVVQTTGTSSGSVMSQDAVSRELNTISSLISSFLPRLSNIEQRLKAIENDVTNNKSDITILTNSVNQNIADTNTHEIKITQNADDIADFQNELSQIEIDVKNILSRISSFVEEAPEDGILRGRYNKTWAPIVFTDKEKVFNDSFNNSFKKQ